MLKAKLVFALIVLVALFGYPVAYRMSSDTMTIHVTDKERITTGSGESISSKFIVYTDEGVFENTDSFLFFKFNSADIQNSLKPGKEYKVKVAGWRLPFFSSYKNIIEVK
jgi:hypothetical protein